MIIYQELSERAKILPRNDKGQFIKGHKLWQNLKMPPELVEKTNGWRRGKHLSQSTEFRKGMKPWNNGLTKNDIRVQKYCFNSGNFRKGEHPNPKTEFKKGMTSWMKGKIGLRAEQHPNWRGGSSFPPYTPEFRTALKKSILKRDNYMCQQCGTSAKIIHHKDLNKSNNKPENLVTFCKSCHMLLHWRLWKRG